MRRQFLFIPAQIAGRQVRIRAIRGLSASDREGSAEPRECSGHYPDVSIRARPGADKGGRAGAPCERAGEPRGGGTSDVTPRA
ncbi:hypothetical protein SSP35_19_00260 [Streptomyces sp. NBRC 110611]|nr:hypothetical protein SSP35_19_00260 [Streptomyces sp. NBRC 110611]